MCTYACMYACVYAWVYACVWLCVRVCECECVKVIDITKDIKKCLCIDGYNML